MASDLTRQVSLASCTYCKYAFSAKSDDSILKTTTLDNPPRPPSQTAAVSSFPLKIVQSQKMPAADPRSIVAPRLESESDIVDSNLPRLLRGNENILDGHLNAAIKGEEDEESIETAPRLRLCSSTVLLATYLKIDSSSTLLTSPSRIKIGIRILSLPLLSTFEAGSHSLATGTRCHLILSSARSGQPYILVFLRERVYTIPT
eukprot:scaffold37721_cov231-Skeletonema_marinoi.AAC.4